MDIGPNGREYAIRILPVSNSSEKQITATNHNLKSNELNLNQIVMDGKYDADRFIQSVEQK